MIDAIHNHDFSLVQSEESRSRFSVSFCGTECTIILQMKSSGVTGLFALIASVVLELINTV